MIGKAVLQNLSAYKQGMQTSEVQEKYNLSKIVKLASNENPYGHSEKVIETMKDMQHHFHLYPDGYALELRQKVAEKFSVKLDQLVFGAGSDEIITLICRAFLSDGVNTVMAKPTFPQYRHHARIEGAEIREIPTINGKHDLDQMAEAMDEQTKVVWLCTPDNPTGNIISQGEFDQFMEKCPKDVVVVLDEAYYEYADASNQLKSDDNLRNYPNVIQLRTFSKIYGIAALRVGYGICHTSIAEQLNIVRGPFNTTALSQKVASAILEDEDFIKMTKRKNKEVRTMFQAFLDELHWTYYPSETNFLLVSTPVDADRVTTYLLQHGFIVRSGNLLGYPNTVRITMGIKEDMIELQEVLHQLDKELRDGVME